MDATDLIIPIRMDPTKVMAVLKQVGSAGKQAANEVEASAGKPRPQSSAWRAVPTQLLSRCYGSTRRRLV